MRRRDFLKKAMALPVMGAGMMFRNPLTMALNSAWAETGQGPILVVIFQRGGNDGLNTVVPYGDPRYYDLRPSLAIGQPGSGAGAALDLDGFFGLHPALAPLHALYQMNELALLPAVHYPNASRSHFEIQKLLEGGSTVHQGQGWLNRYLAATTKAAEVRAASFGGSLAFAMRGDVMVPVVDLNKTSFWGPRDYKTALPQMLQAVYQQPPASKNKFQTLYKTADRGLAVDEKFQALDPAVYKPANDAQYPDTTFGKTLKRLAQVIKAGMGLEVATVDIGGWDSHARQGGAEGYQAKLLQEYAEGVSAFYKDLFMQRQNLLILTMTDFGRTARENGSQGTDHGNAATWMALGGNVRGGIHGQWPGLEEDQLYLGRYLAHTIDFRDVLGEVLNRHLLFSDPDRILAGHNVQPVGFL